MNKSHVSLEQTTIQCSGRLYHRFHGDYSAVIVLETPTVQSCAILAAQLPKIDGVVWRTHEKTVSCGATLNGEQLKVFKDWIEPRRTDAPCTLYDCHPSMRSPWKKPRRHDIDSCAHSIDVGPLFEFEVPYVDLLTKPLPFKD